MSHRNVWLIAHISRGVLIVANGGLLGSILKPLGETLPLLGSFRRIDAADGKPDAIGDMVAVAGRR